MNRRILLALTLGLILSALLIAGLVNCYGANTAADPTPPPTFSVSATPSDTPEPATMTPSATATVAPVTLTAQATAVTTLPPPGTVTAVAPSPSPTPTATATPTAPPEPTATLTFWLVQPGDNLSSISEWLCGRQQWGWIYVENQDIIKNPNIIFSGQRLIIPWPCE